MILNKSNTPYRINLIRDLRDREKKKERQKRLTLILGFGCFGFFLLALVYSGLTIWQMEQVISHERKQVNRLRQEFQKYTASRLIVDKADIEQLDNLKGKGQFWTTKLAALAKYLPENYLITGFSYQNGMMRVIGFGYTTARQDHLLILDHYLNLLRRDSTFSATFSKIQLNTAVRKDEGGKVAFDFSAFTRTWKAE